MEAANYTLIIPEGNICIKLPEKQLEILKALDKIKFPTQKEQLVESRKLYIEQEPQEAKEFYKDKI